jgi:hypothetical protein
MYSAMTSNAAYSASYSNRPISEEEIMSRMDFNSIYIPNLPDDLMIGGKPFSSESDLTYFFEKQLPLGIVKRVDIATRPNRYSAGTHIRCAFVHFESWNLFANGYKYVLARDGEFRLQGDAGRLQFYSSSNPSFRRFITLKINKAPIQEVPPLEAEKMNVHQLVDNYRRLEKQLAEKDAQIAELTAKLADKCNRYNFLSKVAQERLETMRDLEFELMASRCANGDVGKQTDEDPMEMENLTVGLENV